MALSYAKISYLQQEVDLQNKPLDLLKASPKGTVPVLILENGHVLDESMAIIRWALEQSDIDGWLNPELERVCDELIQINDNHFKPILDNYKYPQNSEKKDPVYYREQAKPYLKKLNGLLMSHKFLFADQFSLADVAIFPFIRQFYMVDKLWFVESEYKVLKTWLDYFLTSELFLRVMTKT